MIIMPVHKKIIMVIINIMSLMAKYLHKCRRHECKYWRGIMYYDYVLWKNNNVVLILYGVCSVHGAYIRIETILA